MRWRAWARRAAKIGLALFAVAAIGLWYGFESGWVVYSSAAKTYDLCGGRVLRTFDSFWTEIERRQLDERESYTVYARQGAAEDRKRVALKRCSSRADGDLQCLVHEADEAEGLRQGDSYRVARHAIDNWAYSRGSKIHWGCDPSAGYLQSRLSPCVRAAQESFAEFQWAATRDEMVPTDHWVDVQLEPRDQANGMARPMEARLNHCERLADGSFACRVDSAPPEAGIANGARLVVEQERVQKWSYRLGDRFGMGCDAAARDQQVRLPLLSTGED